MRKAALALIVVGASVTMLLWFCLHNPAGNLPSEPRYQGETLSYWMGHWYMGMRGNQPVENTNAVAALRALGTNALPYLVDCLSVRVNSTFDIDYPSRALRGFRVLGPIAKPAIPELIRMLDTNGNYPAVALGYIGADAVPALMELLDTDNVSRTRQTTGGVQPAPARPARARENAVRALSYLGTNAEAAMPVLINCLNDAQDERLRGTAAEALAVIGHNRSEIVIPALVHTLTNSTSYARASAADALAAFGSEARSTAPLLLSAGHDRDSYLRTHAATALKQVTPEAPDALAPLIQNLSSDDTLVREQALWALETLGTNGADALPALVERLHDPISEVRVIAMRCVRGIDRSPDDIVLGLRGNLSDTNSSVLTEAIRTLGSLAEHSQPAFLALLQAMDNSEKVGRRARSALGNAARNNSAWLLASLENPDPAIRHRALLVLYEVGKPVPESVPKLIPLLRDEDARVRRSAEYMLWLQDPGTAKSQGVKSPW
jgi:HEAT repeat protein